MKYIMKKYNNTYAVVFKIHGFEVIVKKGSMQDCKNFLIKLRNRQDLLTNYITYIEGKLAV